MRRHITLIFILNAFCSSAFANDAEKCSVIQADSERLSCYDAMFRIRTTPPRTEGAWTVEKEQSKIDDTTSVFLSVNSVEELRGRYGRPIRLALILRCVERKTAAYISFGDHFMSSVSGYGIVTYRIDKRPAKRKSMTESNDHKALGLWSGSDAIPFIREIATGQRLYVSAVPYSENTVSAEFEIGGLAKASEPLQQACGWSLFSSPVPPRRPAADPMALSPRQ